MGSGHTKSIHTVSPCVALYKVCIHSPHEVRPHKVCSHNPHGFRPHDVHTCHTTQCPQSVHMGSTRSHKVCTQSSYGFRPHKVCIHSHFTWGQATHSGSYTYTKSTFGLGHMMSVYTDHRPQCQATQTVHTFSPHGIRPHTHTHTHTHTHIYIYIYMGSGPQTQKSILLCLWVRPH